MRLTWPIFRKHEASEPVNHGRALALVGAANQRAKYRATARELCAAIGMPVPAALQERD